MTVTDNPREEAPIDTAPVPATADPTPVPPVGWNDTDQVVPVTTSIRQAAETVMRRVSGSYDSNSYILDMTVDDVRTVRSLSNVRALLGAARDEMAALANTWNLPIQARYYRAALADKTFMTVDPHVYQVLVAEFPRREQLILPDPDSRAIAGNLFDNLSLPPEVLMWLGVAADSGVFSGLEVLSWAGPEKTSDHLLIGWVCITSRRRNSSTNREDPGVWLFAVARWGSGMRDWQTLVALTHQRVLAGLVADCAQKREARLRDSSAPAICTTEQLPSSSPSRAQEAASRRRRRQIRRQVVAICLGLALVLTILVCAYGVPHTSFHGIMSFRTLIRNPLHQ